MFWWLLFAVFLFVACAALIVAEVFVPSGGILSICALVCAAGGVVIFFKPSAASLRSAATKNSVPKSRRNHCEDSRLRRRTWNLCQKLNDV